MEKEDIYKQLFDKDVQPIGTYIKINNINYRVIGMYKKGQIGGGGPQGNIHIPFTTFQQVYNRGDDVGWMMITGQPGFDITQIEADVKLLLKTLHKVHPEDDRAFGSFNLGKEIPFNCKASICCFNNCFGPGRSSNRKAFEILSPLATTGTIPSATSA